MKLGHDFQQDMLMYDKVSSLAFDMSPDQFNNSVNRKSPSSGQDFESDL